MTEKTKRVPLAEYPGADEAVWGDGVEEIGVLSDFLSSLDDVWDYGDTLHRLRPPSTSDIIDFAPVVYDELAENVLQCDGLVSVDGCPRMPEWDDVPEEIRRDWTNAVRLIVSRLCDLSDAAWQETGEVVRLYPDGTVERIDAGGDE